MLARRTTLTALLGLALAASWVQAQVSWDGGAATTNWQDDANWTLNTEPSTGGQAAVIGPGFTVDITNYAASTGTATPSLSLRGTLNIDTGGSLTTVVGGVRVDGDGQLNMAPGTTLSTTGGVLYVGFGTAGTSTATINGSIDLSGGNANFIVGNAATLGIVNFNAGVITLGDGNGSSSGPNGALVVGFNNNGDNTNLWVQDGGTLQWNSSGGITIGHSSTSRGKFELKSGTVTTKSGLGANTGQVTVGFSGNGQWQQSGGTLNVALNSSLVIGHIGSSVGTFEMTGGQINISNGSPSVLGTSIGNLVLGNSAGAVGTATFKGGTITLGKGTTAVATNSSASLIVGSASTSESVWEHDGGTLVWETGGSGGVIVGKDTDAKGRVELKSGSITTKDGGIVNGGNVVIGNRGTAVWNQTGGDLTVALNSALLISAIGQNANSIGTLNLSGGTIATPTIRMDGTGSASLNLSGAGVLSVGDWMIGGNDTVNLTGGTLHTTGAGTIRFTLTNNGTTLSPGAAGTIGVMAITGAGNDLVQNAGVIHIELAGDNSSLANYDRITVADAAVLNGGLQVSLINGFTPTLGVEYHWDILTTGTGSITSNLALINSLPGFSLSTPTPNVLRLSYFAVPEPASAVALILLSCLAGRRRLCMG